MRYLHLVAAVAWLCAVASVSVPATADEYATRDEAVALVKRAIAHVHELGIDKAKVDFMDLNGKFVDRDLYLVVLDQAGVRIVHGQNPKLVGKNFYDAIDANGKEYGRETEQIVTGPGVGWVSYMFKDPVTGKVLPKESYVEKAGNLVYLAGVYRR